MNQDDANEGLLSLIGELLYKNQLLREAIASKDEAFDLIIKHLMSATTCACSCGVASHLTFVRNTIEDRDIELAHRKSYRFNELCKNTRSTMRQIALGARRSELQKNRG